MRRDPGGIRLRRARIPGRGDRGARRGGEDAKLLAGGHSLLPLMKLRLAFPTLLVDLRRVPGLTGIERENGSFRVGAMTTHHQVATGGLGLASAAAATIADQQVRNRGTIGGSLAHGDTASDMPAVLLACEGEVTARGSGGERTIAASELFQDYLTTALAPDEVLTEVRIPAMAGYGFAYEKFNRRVEDWAMVAVCALVKKAATARARTCGSGSPTWAPRRCAPPRPRRRSAEGASTPMRSAARPSRRPRAPARPRT